MVVLLINYHSNTLEMRIATSNVQKNYRLYLYAQMDEEIDSFAGKVTRRQMVGLIDDHATHHRGAAIAYLRANGIVPPPFRGL